MSQTIEFDQSLNQMILSAQALDAFEQYYAADVVMQENSGEPRVGKAINRNYEEPNCSIKWGGKYCIYY